MKTALLLVLLSIFSCTGPKTTAVNTNQENADQTYTPPPPYTGTNPFGILVNAADGVAPGLGKKLSVAKELNVPYVRSTIALSGNPNFTEFQGLESNGFKVLLNITSEKQMSGGTTQKRTLPTDMKAYKSALSNILEKVKPEIVVIENEEANANYYNVDPQQYLIQLGNAIETVHSKGLKITNGGITCRILTLLVYEDYYNRGLKKEAQDYASRCMPDGISKDLPGLQYHKALAAQVTISRQLVEGYKKLPLDYVNFHWYEPVAERMLNNNADEIKSVDTKALLESIDYLRRATGKEVITNEIGQLNQSPQIVKQMMQALLESKIPYAIWYSGDGGEGKAVAVNNGDGTLRPYGIAFRDFIKGLK